MEWLGIGLALLFWALLLVVFVFIVFFLPSYIGYRLCKKWNFLVFLVLPALLYYFYSWFRAFYPEDAFYINHLERFTAIMFDDDIEVVSKYASFPDHFGDYSASAIFKVSPSDIVKLKSSIFPDMFSERSPELGCGTYTDTVSSEIIKLFEAEKNGESICFGFDIEKNTMFFEYHSH